MVVGMVAKWELNLAGSMVAALDVESAERMVVTMALLSVVLRAEMSVDWMAAR